MTGSGPVPFTIKLDTAMGPVTGQLAVDPGPMRLAELVPFAQQLTSVVCDRACELEAREGRPVSCRKGCGACCYQAVPLSPPEAWFLSDLVRSLEPDRQAEVRERFAVVVATLEQHDLAQPLLDELSRDKGSGSAVREFARRYFRLQLACPFLDDGACTIHPHRPLVCREYSVTSPAEWCADPPAHKLRHVPVPASQVRLLAWLTAELTDLGPRAVPLGLALDWAEKHLEQNRRTWPGVELFQRYVAAFGEVKGAT